MVTRATVSAALDVVKAEKLRSALSLAAIAVGVGMLMVAIGMGRGALERQAHQTASIGSNVFMVVPAGTSASGVGSPSGIGSRLTAADVDALSRECPSVAQVAGVLQGVARVTYEREVWSGSILGTTPNFLEVRDWSVALGKPFGGEDLRKASNVCVVGQRVAETLFGSLHPIGQKVRIQQVTFKVTGVLGIKGKTHTGQDQDDIVIVPLSTLQKKIFPTSVPGQISMILVKAKNAQVIDDAQKEVTAVLRQRHGIGPGEESEFTVVDPAKVIKTAHHPARVMAMAAGGIGVLLLLIGGAGIMSVLLDSAAQRADGLRSRIPVSGGRWGAGVETLAEALVLSVMGGVFGMLSTVFISEVLFAYGVTPRIASAVSILVGINSSVVIGLLCGIYPACKVYRLLRNG